MIQIKRLNKSYGDFQALRNLTLTIRKGEIFGLLGPNGAGKSTTLECLLGTKSYDSGNILFANRKNFEKIGVQFQDSRFPDGIKVCEICKMTSVLYKDVYPWKELLNDFGLTDKEKAQVSDLSGGERQRLSLLLALINKPELLILDELTTGLDPQARRNVWSYLNNLKNKGLTILLTSHYMEEVEFLCDTVLILQKGEEIISGTPEDVIRESGQNTLDEAYLYFTNQEVSNEKIAYVL